jgi:Tautomerase enzyme
MPIVRVTMNKGKSQDYIDKMSVSIDRALVESFEMPDGDLFQMFHQLEPGHFKFDRMFGGGPRTEDFVIIVITSDARRKIEKKSFAKTLVEKLQASPGLRPEDVFLILDPQHTLEDFSFGKGALLSEDLAT